MNGSKEWIVHIFSLIIFFAIFMMIPILILDKGIPFDGGQLSIHFYSPRITLLRYNIQKKEIVLTIKNGNLEKVATNERQYSLNQFEKSQPKMYKKIKNTVNEFNSTYRLLVAYVVIIFASGIVFLIPLEFDKNMIITNFICSFASICVTVLYFKNPSLKSDYLLSIVVIFYSTVQTMIKLRTALRW